MKHLDEILSLRQQHISNFLNALSELLKDYLGPGPVCPEDDCDPLALGEFIKVLKTAALYLVPEHCDLLWSASIYAKSDFRQLRP